MATDLIAALQGGYVLARARRNVDHMATAIEMALARIRFLANHDCPEAAHSSTRDSSARRGDVPVASAQK
jgi:hypothetical protein